MSANTTELKPIKDVITELGVDITKGLSDEEVKNRIKKYGYNEVEEKKNHQ